MEVYIVKHKSRFLAYMEFFLIQFRSLPAGLMRRCIRHITASIVCLLISIAMIVFFRHWVFASGIAMTGYLLWPVYTITKGYYEKKVFGIDMVLLKFKQHIGERCTLYFRTADKPYQYVNYYMHLTKKQREWLAEDMILTVYLNEANPMEVLEWDFVGMVQET